MDTTAYISQVFRPVKLTTKKFQIYIHKLIAQYYTLTFGINNNGIIRFITIKQRYVFIKQSVSNNLQQYYTNQIYNIYQTIYQRDNHNIADLLNMNVSLKPEPQILSHHTIPSTKETITI